MACYAVLQRSRLATGGLGIEGGLGMVEFPKQPVQGAELFYSGFFSSKMGDLKDGFRNGGTLWSGHTKIIVR